MPPAVAVPNAPKGLVKKDYQLFISITFPLLLLLLILIFDRHSLSFVSFLYLAAILPVCYSLTLIGSMMFLPWILADRFRKLLLLAVFALSCPAIATLTECAHPSFPWKIALYLSFFAWGAFVDAVLEIPPFLSYIFSMYTIVLLQSG